MKVKEWIDALSTLDPDEEILLMYWQHNDEYINIPKDKWELFIEGYNDLAFIEDRAGSGQLNCARIRIGYAYRSMRDLTGIHALDNETGEEK